MTGFTQELCVSSIFTKGEPPQDDIKRALDVRKARSGNSDNRGSAARQHLGLERIGFIGETALRGVV